MRGEGRGKSPLVTRIWSSRVEIAECTKGIEFNCSKGFSFVSMIKTILDLNLVMSLPQHSILPIFELHRNLWILARNIGCFDTPEPAVFFKFWSADKNT